MVGMVAWIDPGVRVARVDRYDAARGSFALNELLHGTQHFGPAAIRRAGVYRADRRDPPRAQLPQTLECIAREAGSAPSSVGKTHEKGYGVGDRAPANRVRENHDGPAIGSGTVGNIRRQP